MSGSYILDLRMCPAGVPAHRYATRALDGLRPGECVTLLSGENPRVVLRELKQRLGDALDWTIERRREQLWHVGLRLRGPEHVNLHDLLSRAHVRLDAQFMQLTHRVRAGETADARAALRDYGERLRRHVQAENDLLVPALPHVVNGVNESPLAVMRREQDDILGQLAIIEELFENGAPLSEIDTWLGMLAATLAKHEFREETIVFPQWERALRMKADAATLLDQVAKAL